jgi:similar to spore coat protein
MGNIIQNIAGMGNITEQIIASDMLMASKAGIKMYALAITEASTPSVRATLKKHLEIIIQGHEKITDYMIDQGFYYPEDPETQIEMDLEAINTLMEKTDK